MPAELNSESGGPHRTVVRIHSPGRRGHFQGLMCDRNSRRTGTIDNPVVTETNDGSGRAYRGGHFGWSPSYYIGWDRHQYRIGSFRAVIIPARWSPLGQAASNVKHIEPAAPSAVFSSNKESANKQSDSKNSERDGRKRRKGCEVDSLSQVRRAGRCRVVGDRIERQHHSDNSHCKTDAGQNQ